MVGESGKYITSFQLSMACFVTFIYLISLLYVQFFTGPGSQLTPHAQHGVKYLQPT